MSPSRAAQSANLLSQTGAQSPSQLQHQLQQQLQQQLEQQAEAEEQAAAASLQDTPEETINARPVHVHVIGHTSLPSQLQRQRQQHQQQQQQQAHGLMPRVAHYQQSPNAMLGYQQYQSELAQSPHQSPQQQGLALGIHQYQQHADGLMHFQHQPTLNAIQQQQQQMHGVGELVGPGMGLQLQERGHFYGGAEHGAAASQPTMPINYAQVSSYVQEFLLRYVSHCMSNMAIVLEVTCLTIFFYTAYWRCRLSRGPCSQLMFNRSAFWLNGI